jgi:type I restriction enzyme S subunit
MVEELKIAEGFQQTDAGIIPNDWVVKPLHEVAHFENGKAHEQFIDKHGDYIVVNSKFISTEGRVKKFSKKNIFPLRKGDITIVMSDIPKGKALAKCFLIDKEDTYTLNQRIGGITANDDTDNKYLFYKLNRNKYYLAFDSGTGQTNIKRQEILDCPIALPPTKTEQTAISIALENTHLLIAEIEKLLAKKRNIKTGAIQELLKPKAGWNNKTIGDCVEVIGGGTPSSFNSSFWNGEINWFTPTEIGTTKYVRNSVRKISKDGYKNSSAKMLPKGTILLTSRAGIGDLGVLLEEACTNQGFQSLIVKEGIDNEFLYYLMGTLKKQLFQNASGSTFLEISPGKLKSIEITIPEKSEQEEIAKILSEMDNEIVILATQLSKYNMIEKGMKHELLTGKKRLV